MVVRRARERVRPVDVGLPEGARRRTPGLRREEVAMLAGISVDYLVRLEQARGPTPSTQVLGALARTLRLDVAGRNELFHLAGSAPPGPGTITTHVRPSVLRLVDRFADLPVLVLSAKGDVLAWNAMSTALHGDWSAIPPERRNLPRLQLLPQPGDPSFGPVGDEGERQQVTAHTIATLRAAAARYPDDEGLTRLLADLRAGSPDFAARWEAGPAGPPRSLTKRIEHPRLGSLRLDCDTLHVPDDDQTVIVYSAAPGTHEADALALLRVLGTQELTGGSDSVTVVRR